MNPGEPIGEYRLIARIAHGGMGEVWEAEGPKGRVAIKLIPEFLMTDPALVDRLEREAKALNRIDHRGIVRIFEFGQAAGRAYLAMELLKGETLASRLARESPLPVKEAERIVTDLAEALTHIHRRGVIHRDLKPENIFLTESGCVKLIDLGVAKILDEASLTVTGSHFGTPAYMSPESFRDSKQVTAAADVWSMGVILYEAVTGHLPFPGTTAASIIAKISDTNITPQSPTRLRAEIPEKLAGIIGQCLDRQAAMRPSASRLALSMSGRPKSACMAEIDSEHIVYNQPKEVSFMKYLGFFLIAMGVAGCLTIEGIDLTILIAPSALAIIILGAFGGALTVYSWGEIGGAISAIFKNDAYESREAAEDHARIFATLSRSAMVSMWISVIVGAMHILEAFTEMTSLSQIGRLAGGVALALLGPIWGVLIAYFVFDPLRSMVERRGGQTAFLNIQTRPQDHFGALGIFLFAVGVWMLCKIENVRMSWNFFSPSTLVLILPLAFGATLVTFRPTEIGGAFSAFFRGSPGHRSRESLMEGVQIFRLLSRYTLAAVWIGLCIGAIHILGGYEETIQKYGWARGTIRTMGWFSFALAAPLLGYLLSSFVFTAMRHNLERKAGGVAV